MLTSLSYRFRKTFRAHELIVPSLLIGHLTLESPVWSHCQYHDQDKMLIDNETLYIILLINYDSLSGATAGKLIYSNPHHHTLVSQHLHVNAFNSSQHMNCSPAAEEDCHAQHLLGKEKGTAEAKWR